jgi:hypothetical protein
LRNWKRGWWMKEGPKKKKRVTLWISLLLFEFNHLGQLLSSTHQDSKIIIILFGFCSTSYNEMKKKEIKFYIWKLCYFQIYIGFKLYKIIVQLSLRGRFNFSSMFLYSLKFWKQLGWINIKFDCVNLLTQMTFY